MDTESLARALDTVILLEVVYALLSPQPGHAFVAAVFAALVLAWAHAVRLMLA